MITEHEKLHRKAAEESKETETRLAFLEEQIELRVSKVQLRQDMAAYATKLELQDLAQRVDLCALTDELEDFIKASRKRMDEADDFLH